MIACSDKPEGDSISAPLLVSILCRQLEQACADAENDVSELMALFFELGESESNLDLINKAIVKLQFADKLFQRVDHVKRSLQLLSNIDSQGKSSSAVSTVEEFMRSVYSTDAELEVHFRELKGE